MQPTSLKLGDLVRFVKLPDEWSRPGYRVHASSVAFMRKMIRRSWPARVCEIDEYGHPTIHARMRERGRIVLHTWAIVETTGWRLVKRRTWNKDRKS